MGNQHATFSRDGVITYEDGSVYPFKAGERVTILSDFTTTQYFVQIEEGLAKNRKYYFDKSFISVPSD